MSTIINNSIYFNVEGNTQPGLPSDPSPGDNPTPEKKDPSKAKGSIKRAAGIATMVQLGKSALGYATSHVGMYTGSSDMQDKVNAGLGVAGTAVAIAENPAMGLAMTAFNLATKALDYSHKWRQENIGLIQLRKRGGPSMNRSRLEAA